MARMLRPLLLLACLATLAAADATSARPTPGCAVLPLSGSFPLRSTAWFDEEETELFSACMQLRGAMRNRAGTLVLDLSGGFAPGLAAGEELAGVLREERTRSPGKRVVALIDAIDDRALPLLAQCDEVVACEAGVVSVQGLSLASYYFADALARLGIRMQAAVSGEFKSAPEAFTRNAPSEATRSELRALAASLDQGLAELGRREGLDLAALRAAAPQAPAAAVRLGLAGRSVEAGAFLAALPEPVAWLGRDQKRHDLSTFSGALAFWRELLEGDTRHAGSRVVALVELAGEVMDGSGGVPGETIAGDDSARLLDDLADDRRVVAVVLRVDSPGGTASAADRIHFALRRLAARKPVVALFDGVAASGGYYLACAAHEVLVHRTTITGSIGAFALLPDASGTLDLLGVRRFAVNTGPLADLDDPTAPASAVRREALQRVVQAVDERFRQVVAESRRLDPATVKELAGGRVYSGDQAVANRLADGIGTVFTAVAKARLRAGIDSPLPVERYPRKEGLLARLGIAREGTRALLPARARLWLAIARRPAPTVMAWSNLGR